MLAVDTLTVVQPSGIKNHYFDWGMSLLLGGGVGGGRMCGIKIPQQDFVLKMQGGTYLQDTTVHSSFQVSIVLCHPQKSNLHSVRH